MRALRISGELKSVMSPERSRIVASPETRTEMCKAGRCGIWPMFCQSLRLDAMGFDAPRASAAGRPRFSGKMALFIERWIRKRGELMQGLLGKAASAAGGADSMEPISNRRQLRKGSMRLDGTEIIGTGVGMAVFDMGFEGFC